MHHFFEKGQIDKAHWLIGQGLDVMARNVNGDTPLHLASKHGHIAIAKWFVQFADNKDPRNFNSETPLNLALSNGHIELTRMLVENGCNITNNR